MRRTIAILCGLLIVNLFAVALHADEVGFGQRPLSELKIKLPDVPLTPEQIEEIKTGKPVCLLVPTDDQLKAGFMRVVVPMDPVTTWWIVQDIKHFHLTDPAYPKNGSIMSKRRSFMPYVFDGVVCEVDGDTKLYQLLVMPLVAPRKYSLDRYPNRKGFPWESAWHASKDLYCADQRNREMDDYFDKAVQITHNNGCWRLSPVPENLRAMPGDAAKTYIEYYVDTNPGGNLEALAAIVNKATSTAMPNLHNNLLFHGKRWEEHMKKHHTPEEIERYHAELAAYKKAMGLK